MAIDFGPCDCCGGTSCCFLPKSSTVTVAITSTGTSGCECIGTQTLDFVLDSDPYVWLKTGVAVCSTGNMDFEFGCFFDSGFYYWALGIVCHFGLTAFNGNLISSPMVDRPNCCPIDITLSGSVPDSMGACCGGTLPYSITAHITSSCP